MKALRFFVSLGMLAAVSYILHDVLGSLLWQEYSPVQQLIATLTATGAPNAALLRIFTLIYGVCFVLFSGATLVLAIRAYHGMLRAGCAIMLLTSLISLLGFGLFPQDITDPAANHMDMMHALVNIAVTAVVITAVLLIAMGYLLQDNEQMLGYIAASSAGCIALFGVLYSLAVGNGWPFVGLLERLSNYSFHIGIFIYSFLLTFRINLADGRLKPRKNRRGAA